MRFVNPTGKGIRNDAGGQGYHGAPRGTRKHDGIDYAADVDQIVVAVHEGLIPRESLPYGNDLRWRGVHIIHERIETKMWYLRPFSEVIGTEVRAGQAIGFAQNIGEKEGYEGVTPHIHVRIVKIDPTLVFGDPAVEDEIF